ncbi:MAG: hypothetical protein AAFQ87_14270 [Bacteroidota bacterium]
MIKALYIHNHIEGLSPCFQSNERVQYDAAYVGDPFEPDLMAYDLLIVPCGSDQIAMLRIKDQIRAFLDAGKTLFCFDGWFTDWLPGNRWIMDNSKKTIDVRYSLQEDPYHFFQDVNLNSLIYSNGISGWWACGYIEPASQAKVILEDTWGRAIMVLDEVSTAGKIVMTASGPLSDKTYATTDDAFSEADLARLYQNLLHIVQPSLIQA